MLISMIGYEKAHFNMKGKILTDQLFTYRKCWISYSFSLCLRYFQKSFRPIYSGHFDNIYRYSISWLLIRYEYNMLSNFHDLTYNCQLCISNKINIFLPEIAKCNQRKYQNNKWYRIPNHFKHPTHVSDVQFDLKSLIISLVDVIVIFVKNRLI